MESREFDSLVANFFKAATGAVSWDRALGALQDGFSAHSAIVQAVDPRDGRVLALHIAGPTMHDSILQFLREYQLNGMQRHSLIACGSAGVGQWWHCEEHANESFVTSDSFPRDRLQASPARHLASVALRPKEHVVVTFAMEMSAARGPLTLDEREDARRLGLHLREALVVQERVRQTAGQAVAGHGLLQGFAYPIWLIDVERYVLFANDAAKRECANERRASLRGVRFVLERDAADRLLTEQIRQLSKNGRGATGAIDLRTTQSDPPTWLHLTWMAPGEVLGAFGDRPQVLVTLFDPTCTRLLDPYALRSLFGLTPTEARVAARLADGATPDAISKEHGSTLSTVRFQIRQVLSKLGMNRTTDVIRLLRQGEALWAKAGSGLNRYRGKRSGGVAVSRCAAGSAMLLIEAIRLGLQQEQHHEPIVTWHHAAASTHARGHAPAQARAEDADLLRACRAQVG